jgi:KilA-N domain
MANINNTTGLVFRPILGVMTLFTEQEVTLSSGKVIPKGYIRATDLTQAASAQTGKRKEWSKFFKSAQAQEYMEALAEMENCVIENDTIAPYGALAQQQGLQALVIVNKGGNNLDETGIFVHPLVAKHYAMWLSPVFAVRAIKVIDAVLNGDFVALTPEAEQLKEQLQQTWNELRNKGITTRRALTDAIKDWYDHNPEGTSRPYGVMYAATTNAIYERL